MACYKDTERINIMNTIYDEWPMWQQLLSMLENQFGNRCEIILHDLTKEYDHTIVDIRNGHITNRKIGDCGSNLGLEVLRGTVQDGNRYNYVVTTRDGKILRSSTLYIRNSNDEVVGCLCINTDITETVRFEEFLKQYNQYNPSTAQMYGQTVPAAMQGEPVQSQAHTVSDTGEVFANDVSQVLEYLISEADRLIGKPVAQMKREDKIEFIRFLDKKGAFLITKASEKVYEHLKISRFTLYNYLDAVRRDSDSIPPEE